MDRQINEGHILTKCCLLNSCHLRVFELEMLRDQKVKVKVQVVQDQVFLNLLYFED